MTVTVLSPDAFAETLEEYYTEASDDHRKVAVGLQETSRQAEIYARYAHVYSKQQADALAEARDAETDPRRREELERLWLASVQGYASAELVQIAQDLTNDQLAWRTEWEGEQVSANTIGALLASEPDFDKREQLYALSCAADREFADRELDLAVRGQELFAEAFGLPGEIEIAEMRMGIDVRAFSRDILAVADTTEQAYLDRAPEMFELLLGRKVARPSRAHAQYMRSLPVHDDVFTREGMIGACSATLAELGFPLDSIPTIRPDLEDRPQKTPRACVIATRVPDEVYLIVRPTGGLNDYEAFLHEAGHALHYGLIDSSLPFAFRKLDRDFSLTEIYSYVVERIGHNPRWLHRHFDVSAERAEQITAHIRFIDAMLYRRYAAKLAYELKFWEDPRNPENPATYQELLERYTSNTYSRDQWVADMDSGLYAADYLRAWRTANQVIGRLEADFGDEWFANPKAGDWLRELFRQGTEPTNEGISRQVGSSPDDYSRLIESLQR